MIDFILHYTIVWVIFGFLALVMSDANKKIK